MSEIFWNRKEINDVFNMMNKHTGFVSQITKLLSMTMCHPFVVFINTMPLELQTELQNYVKTDWTRSMKQILLWRFGAGIVPYFIVKINDTAHGIPHIPSHLDGDIKIVKDKKNRKKFKWVWNNCVSKPNPDIYWLYTGDEPDVDGSIRSPAMAALEDWRMLCIAREDAGYASFHASHPYAMYEDKPPVSGRDENKYEDVRFDMYGSDEINKLLACEDAQREHEIQYHRKNDVLKALYETGIMSREQLEKYGGGSQVSVLNSDTTSRDIDRKLFSNHSIVLPKDRHFAGQLKPEILLNVQELDQTLTVKAGELIGIPTELTQSTSKAHTANKGGIQMISTETLKATIQWMNDALTNIYTKVYGKTIINGWDKFYDNGNYNLYPPSKFKSTDSEIKNDMEIASKVEITVELQCDPVLELDTILLFHEKGFITKDHAVELLSSKTGLSKGILSALAKPDRLCMSAEDSAKLDLEEKRLKSDQQKYEIDREKIKSDAKRK
jgi:hypothetical protein